MRRTTFCFFLFLGSCVWPLAGADLPFRNDPRVIPVYQSDRVWNGIALTGDGRAFACYPSTDGPGPQVQELKRSGKAVPWPSRSWNAWKPGASFDSAFVHANSIRMGPDGTLWVVDGGASGIGKPAVPGAGRLIGFDVAAGRMTHLYKFDGCLGPRSFVDDVRFHGLHAYLTDAGQPGLLVLDLKSGKSRRVLDGAPAATDLRPMYADGHLMKDKNGREVRVHADQLEVSPDGRYFYFQPASGPLARIETRWLDDPAVSPADLARHVEAPWVDTPTSGGTAIDAKGNIYMGDANRRRILKISPGRHVTTLAADPRFVWTDAMWIDRDGFLWIPAAQLNRVPDMNGGKNAVLYPVWIYKLKIGIGPSAIDHF